LRTITLSNPNQRTYIKVTKNFDMGTMFAKNFIVCFKNYGAQNSDTL